MKTRLTITLLVLVFFQLKAQKISDANSFTQIISLSEKLNKPILLIVNPPAIANRQITKLAYQESDMIKNAKQHFVIFVTDLSNTDVKPIISTYKITRFPAFLFMRSDKEVFHSGFGGTTNKVKYKAMLNSAISLEKEPSGNLLESIYLADTTNNESIKKLIAYRNQKGIGNNAKLIDQYVRNLKPEDFNDYNTVLYILKGGPYAYGTAYKAARSNKKIIDSLYKHEPLKTRVEMHNAIISNTLQEAIKSKNVSQAHNAASFAKNTYGKNINTGNRAYSSNMMSYYKAVNDTASYFKLAISFYDRYFMTLSADSIKKNEVKRQIAFAKNSFKKPSENVKVVTKSQFDSLKKLSYNHIEKETSYMVVSGVGNSHANTLNNVAWYFYTTGTKNFNHLTKAMLWSKRAIELSSATTNAAYYDTLAHLLYRLGDETEAIKTQEDAITKAKAQRIPFDGMQADLKKMKNRTL